MNNFLDLAISSTAHLSINGYLLNLVLGLVLSLIIRSLYINYSQTISNKQSIGNIFPLLTIIVVLIISVVKASLALSLGLVGALSIVRFRSAIKEPEELVYLFLALATGVALGANQRIPAIITILFVALMLMLRNRFFKQKKSHNFMITFDGNSESTHHNKKEKLLEMIKDHSIEADIRRIDVEEKNVQLRIMVKMLHIKKLLDLIEKLEKEFPQSHISFVDTDTIL